MQAGDLCRAARTLDHPLGLADYSENMAALDRFEGGSRQVRGRRRGAGGELGVALKVEGGAGREDDSALQVPIRRTVGVSHGTDCFVPDWYNDQRNSRFLRLRGG